MRKSLFLPAVLLSIPALASGEAGKEKSAAKPQYQSFEERMRVDLSQEVKELPPLPDAAKRKEAFERRNDPEQIEALAHQLFALWDPAERGSSRQPALTKTLDRKKAQVYALYKEGKYQEALDAFREYFFAKVKVLFRDDKGLTSRDYLNWLTRDREKGDAALALTLNGVYQVSQTKETVRLGEPGLTRWDFKPSGPRLWENVASPAFEYFSNSPFEKLWWKFIDTKDQKYLDLYLAYWDDYYLNHKLQENVTVGNLDLGKFGANNAFASMFAISEISRWLPPTGEGYSSATLARQVIRFLSLELPQSVYYNREQSNNHSTGAVHNFLALSNLLYDFRFAKVMEREARRQFEAYGTLFDLPDGAMPGKNIGYSYHELQENLISIKRIREYGYDWATPQWDREMTDRLMRRGFYVLNLANPNGEGIQVYKGDWRNYPFDEVFAIPIFRALPRLWDTPAVPAIAARIVHNQVNAAKKGGLPQKTERPMANEGEGLREGAEPPYTSISFPYTQTHILRNGWDPETVAYGVFSVNGGRGDDGGLFHNLKCSNILQIGALGKDLLTNGVDAVYNFVPSPVLVDGLSQFAIGNKGPSGRKGDNNEGLIPLGKDRIHHSSSFDVVEGLYDGLWADTVDHDPEFYDWKYRNEVMKKAVSGISHRRAVHFVKEYGIWVVVDLLNGPAEHEYTQQFFVLHSVKKGPQGYKVEDFSVDQNALALRSASKELPNISIYYAGPAANNLQIAEVAKKAEQVDEYIFERGDRKRDKEFLHLKSSWKAKGPTLLITVLEGSGPGRKNPPISEFKRDANGFVAKLADGETLQFSAQVTKDNPEGFESKLTLSDKNGTQKGVVLGAKSYEFSGANGADMTPVYRPIRDLQILPERHVFDDTLEVSVISPDEDVDIRYTLDGRDPTLESPIYTKPVKLSGSALFKARAFRKGLKEMTVDPTSGTLVGRVFSAPFTREELVPAVAKAEAETKPGLKYEYFTAKWPYLLFGAPTLKPAKEGVVKGLFDISPVSEGQAFGLLYSGYLEIPEDGVYTFYAPDEFMKFRPLAGYDLMVWLGKAPITGRGQGETLIEWYPATGRHGFGTWSKALRKGLHPIKVYYADLRPGAHLEYHAHRYPELNIPGQTKTFFDGKTPVIEVSGPGVQRQPIPVAWYRH